ncbi:glycosyltransferase [Vibrio sp. 10N.261.46.A3]|uniref:glycosyltransferase n=1 Tax=Vibrio sp. 10N.261.46.A3 TaxID=3229658 RepID=UPI00354CE0A7
MNVIIYSNLIIPSVAIGLMKPLLHLQKQGLIDVKISKVTSKTKVNESADIVIFCRSQCATDLSLARKYLKSGKKVIYDIDDNFFSIPDDNPIGKHHRYPERIYILEKFLSESSLVCVYSDIMYKKALKYNRNVALSKTYFDKTLLSGLTTEKSDVIKIALATGRAADPSFEKPLELALEKLLEEYPKDRLELHFWREPYPLIKKFDNVKWNSATPDYEEFIRNFYRKGFDIGLAPIGCGEFFNSKTNNKYREYGGCSVAGVYSNMPLYNTSVKDGFNGVLVRNDEASWYSGIKKLIESQKLRNHIVQNAKSDINDNYNFNAICDSKLLQLDTLNCEINPKVLVSDDNFRDVKVCNLSNDNVSINKVYEQLVRLGFIATEYDYVLHGSCDDRVIFLTENMARNNEEFLRFNDFLIIEFQSNNVYSLCSKLERKWLFELNPNKIFGNELIYFCYHLADEHGILGKLNINSKLKAVTNRIFYFLMKTMRKLPGVFISVSSSLKYRLISTWFYYKFNYLKKM